MMSFHIKSTIFAGCVWVLIVTALMSIVTADLTDENESSVVQVPKVHASSGIPESNKVPELNDIQSSTDVQGSSDVPNSHNVQSTNILNVREGKKLKIQNSQGVNETSDVQNSHNMQKTTAAQNLAKVEKSSDAQESINEPESTDATNSHDEHLSFKVQILPDKHQSTDVTKHDVQESLNVESSHNRQELFIINSTKVLNSIDVQESIDVKSHNVTILPDIQKSPDMQELSDLLEQCNGALTKLRCRHELCRCKGGDFPFYTYQVEGNDVLIGEGPSYLHIDCSEANVLTSPALPRADSVWDVLTVELMSCPLPVDNSSLWQMLSFINVRLHSREPDTSELILESLPAEPPLNIFHFENLNNLVSLKIYAKTFMYPLRHSFIHLSGLRSLKTINVKFSQNFMYDMEGATQSIRNIDMVDASLSQLPSALIGSLEFRELIIKNELPIDLLIVPLWLREMYVSSPATKLLLKEAPVLEELTLTNWTEPRPPALESCSSLLSIYLESPAASTLPESWLANCYNLVNLDIIHAQNLTNVPATLFCSPGKFKNNHWKINHVAFRYGVLETLPEGLFSCTTLLFNLELDGNRFRTLPSDLPVESVLQKLTASSNELEPNTLNILAQFQKLMDLNLANNPRLSVVCDEAGYSPMQNLTKLNRLLLHGTNVTSICRDWREDMTALEYLDLSDTNMAKLSLSDLQFTRSSPAKVVLTGAPIAMVEASVMDFNTAPRAPLSHVSVLLGSVRLHCDCHMYWTRRILERSSHALAHITELRCIDGRLLREMSPEEMVCDQPKECHSAALPTTCACSVRPDDDPTQSQMLVRVGCYAAGLTEIPRPRHSMQRLYELELANNGIAELYPEDLHQIKGLDLRNNSLKTVSVEAALRLSNVSGVVLLAGNPLDCSCHNAPLLRALLTRDPALTDLDYVTCSDGTMFRDVSIEDCQPPTVWIAGGLTALVTLTVTAVIAACLASRERRFFIRAVLHRWGCQCYAADTGDEERRFDAFLTFSHKDETVALEMMARLEPTYRLCIHHRDWIAGLRIPDQIVESVRDSRRTVALVSRHFLTSSWTRVEFREAHAAAMLEARPRLIVVLLEDPAALTMDEELRRYVASHTYLRWGDPWFWDKLAIALPRPHQSPRKTPDTTPAASPSNTMPANLAASPAVTVPLSAAPISSPNRPIPALILNVQTLTPECMLEPSSDVLPGLGSAIELAVIPPHPASPQGERS